MKKFLFALLLLNFSNAEAQTSAFSVADSLFRIGKYAEAISVYKEIEPTTAKFFFKIAQAYNAQGNLGKAIKNYELGLANKPATTSAVVEYGNLLYRTGKFKKADSIFQNLTEHFPENPDFHYRLGLAKEQLNDSTAIIHFRKTVSLESSHQKAIFKLAVHHFQLKNYHKVELLGKKALTTYPNNEKILGLLGQNSLAQEDYQSAEKYFDRLVSLSPNAEFAHEKLAYSCYHLDEFEKALKHYKKVIQLNPQHVNAYYFSGNMYNSLGKTEEAEASLKKALQLKKRGLSGMYQSLGITYKLEKNYAKAIDYFKLALTENDDNMLAQYELALAADQYYKDLQTRINYYKLFVKKFKFDPRAEPFLQFIDYRIDALKKEKFMNK